MQLYQIFLFFLVSAGIELDVSKLGSYLENEPVLQYLTNIIFFIHVFPIFYCFSPLENVVVSSILICHMYCPEVFAN